MPWKESSVMEERLRFVARLLDGHGPRRPRATPGASGCRRGGPLCEALQTENAQFEHYRV
jgi:hypothetical protein